MIGEQVARKGAGPVELYKRIILSIRSAMDIALQQVTGAVILGRQRIAVVQEADIAHSAAVDLVQAAQRIIDEGNARRTRYQAVRCLPR